MNTHTGERPYKCDFEGCKYAAADESTLRRHKFTHSGEKPFKCNFEGCGYACAQRINLESHMNTHTGDRPYKCDFEGCGFATAQPSNLIGHKRIHTGERPYKCEFEGCGAAFSLSGTLVTHMRTHTGERPYICQFEGCGAAFITTSNRDAHFRYYHTAEGQQEHKREEVKIANILPKESFKREHQVDYRCLDASMTFCRLDFLLPFWKKKGHVIIEVDEQQHSFYSQGCETARMNNVVTSWLCEGSDDPVVWIRYNPHGYTKDGVQQRTKQKVRHKALLNLLNNLEFDNQPNCRIYYMFYDTVDGIPCVLSDPEYQESVKSWVVT